MIQQNRVNQPLLNGSALIRSLSMWLLIRGAAVLLVTYQKQPGVVCLTPMAWLLAIPAGWNYVVFSRGKPGRQPFVAGAILGALLGLLYGLLQSSYRLPSGLVGPGYGLAVYGVGPAWLVPAMKIMGSPSEEPPLRTTMLIASHLVYGAAVAEVFQALEGRSP